MSLFTPQFQRIQNMYQASGTRDWETKLNLIRKLGNSPEETDAKAFQENVQAIFKTIAEKTDVYNEGAWRQIEQFLIGVSKHHEEIQSQINEIRNIENSIEKKEALKRLLVNESVVAYCAGQLANFFKGDATVDDHIEKLDKAFQENWGRDVDITQNQMAGDPWARQVRMILDFIFNCCEVAAVMAGLKPAEKSIDKAEAERDPRLKSGSSEFSKYPKTDYRYWQNIAKKLK